MGDHRSKDVIVEEGGRAGTERAWRRAQAVSGLVFLLFTLLHVVNTMLAAVGPGASRVRMYGVGGRFLGVGRMSAEGARVAPERIMIEVPERASARA